MKTKRVQGRGRPESPIAHAGGAGSQPRTPKRAARRARQTARHSASGSAPDLQEIFGSALRAARLAKGLTQEKLGAEARLSGHSIGRMEGGQLLPSVPTLERLGRALGVSTSFLLGHPHQKPTWGLMALPHDREARRLLLEFVGRVRECGPRTMHLLRAVAARFVAVKQGSSSD